MSNPFRQMVAAWLNWDGSLRFYIYTKEGRANVIFQKSMKAIMVRSRVIRHHSRIRLHYKRMTGIVTILSQVTAESQGSFSLLLGFNFCDIIQAAAEKLVDARAYRSLHSGNLCGADVKIIRKTYPAPEVPADRASRYLAIINFN